MVKRCQVARACSGELPEGTRVAMARWAKSAAGYVMPIWWGSLGLMGTHPENASAPSPFSKQGMGSQPSAMTAMAYSTISASGSSVATVARTVVASGEMQKGSMAIVGVCDRALVRILPPSSRI